MTKTAPPPSDHLIVSPPSLHPGQLQVLHDPARFKILRAGRRWRKSGLGVVQAFTGYDGTDRRMLGALDGGQVGWWVPSLTARYLVTDWHPIRALAGQIPGTRVEEANHRVVLPNGGSIMLVSGDNIDSGRGLGLDGAVIDEATLMLGLLWSETIRATLVDREGWALFLFTPKGLDWVHDLEVASKDLPDWQRFHFRSHDNPTLATSELDALTAEMSTLTYKQEILAEYVTAGAGVFHAEWIQHYWTRFDGEAKVYMLGEEAVPAATCRTFHTVDLAWSLEEDADYTVISTWAVTPKKHLLLVNVDRGRFEGPDIVPRMRQALTLYGGHLVVEKATRQMSIIQEAVRAGLPIREAKMGRERGADAKLARALPATARMEMRTIWFPPPTSAPWYRAIEEELLAFPAGRHDDFVDTLAYAVLEIGRQSVYASRGLETV